MTAAGDPAPVPAGAEQLAEMVHGMLAVGGSTVAVAESLTGGLLGAALTATPGASATFRGGVTAYATAVKTTLLGVDPQLLATHGAVHPEVARAMAGAARERLGATYGLATTGVAGPQAQDGHPVGTVYVGFAGPEGHVVRELRLTGGRAEIRSHAVTAALALLRQQLEG
jgi:nicotinamide-nucleotide amidase